MLVAGARIAAGRAVAAVKANAARGAIGPATTDSLDALRARSGHAVGAVAALQRRLAKGRHQGIRPGAPVGHDAGEPVREAWGEWSIEREERDEVAEPDGSVAIRVRVEHCSQVARFVAHAEARENGDDPAIDDVDGGEQRAVDQVVATGEKLAHAVAVHVRPDDERPIAARQPRPRTNGVRRRAAVNGEKKFSAGDDGGHALGRAVAMDVDRYDRAAGIGSGNRGQRRDGGKARQRDER